MSPEEQVHRVCIDIASDLKANLLPKLQPGIHGELTIRLKIHDGYLNTLIYPNGLGKSYKSAERKR